MGCLCLRWMEGSSRVLSHLDEVDVVTWFFSVVTRQCVEMAGFSMDSCFVSSFRKGWFVFTFLIHEFPTFC